MPTYVYRCEHCGKEFERIETISEARGVKTKVSEVCKRDSRQAALVHRDDIQQELSASCVRCTADFISASFADDVDSRAQTARGKQGRPAWISFSC
jgi:putative FmdB family regulatory protein